MRHYLSLLAFALILIVCAPANAQQPSIEDLQNIIPSLENQRNMALTNQAFAEARERKLIAEVAKLKAELDALKPKPPEPPKK